MKIIYLLLLLFPTLIFAHGGGFDKQGGHFDHSDGTYHCHREPCFSIQAQSEKAFKEAKPGTYSKIYDRDDWPHWIDVDRDCQDTRSELLIATSKVPVKFKKLKSCVVQQGKWYGVYTGETFTEASDVDIEHIVPLAHAHRHGAEANLR